MATADTFCVFAEEAAAGLLGFLPVVAVKEGGRRFFETTVWVALAGLALGVAVRFIGGGEWPALKWTAVGLCICSFAIAFAALKVLQSPAFEKAKPILAVASVFSGAALVVEGSSSVLTVASLLAGAALMGSVTLAMILGHFYLVIPRLSIDPLRRLTNGYLVSILARIAIAGLTTALVWNVEVEPGRSLLMDQAMLLMPRVLFGLIGPLILCFLARGTVAISSTQSATGILYGATVFVVFGELAACHLALSAKLPL
jgi:hypothetical protein